MSNEAQKENLERLVDELIQVFNHNNIDKISDVQKEELIQRVLKLGGDKYTFEDLRRDLLIIDDEDKNSKPEQSIKDRMLLVQGDVIDVGRKGNILDVVVR